jgi:hypothetical protein
MFALLAVLPLVASPSDLPSIDSGLIHRVQAQSIGGSGGTGGSAAPIINNYGNLYLTPHGGPGGNGGNAIGGPVRHPTPAPMVTGRSGVTTSVISKCTLKIAGKQVVAATDCGYASSAEQMQVKAPSETTDYTMQVVYNPDKSGQGFLASGKTPAPRDLGTMTRQGACWRNMDASVEICAWK